MLSVKIYSYKILVLSLFVTQNVFGRTVLGLSEKEKSAATGERTQPPSSSSGYGTVAGTKEVSTTIEIGQAVSSSGSEHESGNANNLEMNGLRDKRSLPLDDDLGDVDDENEMDDKAKRIFSDYGYGSRMQAGENVADDLARHGLFGITGPGKRAKELIDTDTLMEESEETVDKRIPSDYGYGSRYQAAENVANSWDRNRLFGIDGPGKRNAVYRRLVPDFGYGSRAQAASNAAFSAGTGDLFGRRGPGKRNFEFYDKEMMPDDYSYKNRLSPLYRIGVTKRIMSDFGYGSREQAAENIAKSSGSDTVFGVYGPGKRSKSDESFPEEFQRQLRLKEKMSGDSGYGSRIKAGSRIANDVVAIDNLYGLFGPGRRKRSPKHY